jgi:hypothetical protein
MAERKMRPVDLATLAEVDPKTVEAWLRDENRVPHPGARSAVAEKLGVSEMTLWPAAVRNAVKLGVGREIVWAYTSRAAVPTQVWADLIDDAERSITFAGYTSYFVWLAIPDLRRRLREKVAAGCEVRFLIGDPDSEITRRRETVEAVALTVGTRIAVTIGELEHLRDVVSVRKSDRHISLSVFLFDDDALVCQHLGSGLGHDSPTLHLRRKVVDGLFDRYSRQHVDVLWQAAVAVWP